MNYPQTICRCWREFCNTLHSVNGPSQYHTEGQGQGSPLGLYVINWCHMQHYVPSLLALKGLEDETDCSGSMTYVHWWGDGEHMQPETFNLWEVSGDLVEQMR